MQNENDNICFRASTDKKYLSTCVYCLHTFTYKQVIFHSVSWKYSNNFKRKIFFPFDILNGFCILNKLCIFYVV